MNLIEALEIIKKPQPEDASSVRVFLACGFTTLHLQTFLNAHLRRLSPATIIEIETGLFGDLLGNLQRLDSSRYSHVVVAMEWADLDPRLGIRSLGGWQVEKLPEILEQVALRLESIDQAVRSIPIQVTISLPTLPILPVFHTPNTRSSTVEMALRRQVATFAEGLSQERRIAIVREQALHEISPLSGRFDFKSEISTGFPYKTTHASALAAQMALLMLPHPPKKGLITDLDGTLWAGILGEDGPEGVHWHLEEHAQLHGLYQQMLASLASSGTLIAIASKNDPGLVARAFERDDLLLPKTSVYPVEAGWSRKSESVARILEAWNVLPDSVVFVDDSPMEIAEVSNVFPEMECVAFPQGDYAAFPALLDRLRQWFGKPSVTEEDTLRLESLRSASVSRDFFAGGQVSMTDFLRAADGKLTFLPKGSEDDSRALELVNKTNQFNLNGVRYDAAGWAKALAEPSSHLVTVAYEDKFGRLGRISAMLGRLDGKTFTLATWVMSCRAFSRRIEFHCLAYLYETLAIEEIVFEVAITGRNGPLLEFLQRFSESAIELPLRLSRETFFSCSSELPHSITQRIHAIG